MPAVLPFATRRILATGAVMLATAAAADDPRVEFTRGVLEDTRGDEPRAAARFESALRLDPGALPLVARVAALRLRAGDLPGATRVWRELAERRPGDAPVHLAYADFLKQAGGDDALAKQLRAGVLERLLAGDAADPRVVERLFHLRMEEGDAAAARRLLENLGPESAVLHASLAKTVYDANDPAMLENIRARFEAAVAMTPEDPVLARAASEHFRTHGAMDEAVSVLTRHTRAAPWSLDLRARMGILQFAAKHEGDGRATLEELLEIHPNHALAHQALAKFHRQRGNERDERFHAGELLKIRGGSPTDFLELAGKWLDADEPRAARLLLEKAVFIHPEHAGLARLHAIASRRDPETREQSIRHFREAAALGEERPDPEFLLEAAGACLDAGESRQAEDHLRAAIRAFPPDAKKQTAGAMRRLADLWDAEKRNAGPAAALRQRAGSLDPRP